MKLSQLIGLSLLVTLVSVNVSLTNYNIRKLVGEATTHSITNVVSVTNYTFEPPTVRIK